MLSIVLVVVFANIVALYGEQDPSIVETEYGPIKGLLLSEARVFLSIPYAAPPINELRWVNPQAPKPWTSTLDCTKTVVGCPQKCKQLQPDTLWADSCPAVISEDCLFLNIWTPLTATPTSNLPVLLWIHGGGFKGGYSGGFLYNGTRMVSETNNVIIVSINYRIGVLGWLYDTELGLKGNYGYNDQVFAIEWTYRNIQNFGGNPQRIVIFGESAGAHSVALHLLNKTSIIAGGIMESATLGIPLRTNESWGTLPLTFSVELGCDPNKLTPIERLKCLKSITNSTQIVDVQISSNNDDPQNHYSMIKNIMAWTPTVGPIINDGSRIIDQPLTAIKNGEYNRKIQWMIGTNSGEGFAFITSIESFQSLDTMLSDYFGKENAIKIEEFYNITQNNTNNIYLSEEYGNIFTDFMFRCPSRNITESSVVWNSYDDIGYFYHFNYNASYIKRVYYFDPICWRYICHTEELPLVWNPNGSSLIDFHPTPQEILIANNIQFYWTNFAETGNPSIGKNGNNRNLVKWLNYDSNIKQQTLMINNIGLNGIIMQNKPDQQICDFWDTLGYDWFNGTNW